MFRPNGRRKVRQKKCAPRLLLEALESRILLDVSAAAILQADDASYANLENRTPDIFLAGYGQLLTPPPGRADSGNQSVGYDVYNRFDLGGPGDPTLYGTGTGLEALIAAVHQMGGSYYSDLVWNHDGFSNLGTQGFAAAGGYPGFALTLDGHNYAGYNDIDGDFHSAFDNSLTGMRLAGLIDIAQEKNYQFIRSPVDPNNPMNLPPGTTPAFGRLANVADPNNAQFYPDTSLQPIVVFDPKTGEQNIKIYPFNNANPLHGTAVPENALGYLMRYAQWMVQVVGVDGFRIDAAKNMPPWVLNYLDRAVYRSSFRTRLDGSQEPIFSFGEVFDGDKSFVQQFIRKDINPADPGTIGGNRDALDFPLLFALQNNLTNNGLQNDWTQVVNASIDSQDDGLANNGSQGVSFVSSHDSFGPYLSNVGYAYTLTHPGNSIVYFNAHEFGQRDFPKDGRGDALGGLFGNTITTLVNIRDTHPDGNYIQRDLEKEINIYERDDSMLVALNNRMDAGFDSRTVHTDFAPGTYLIELTGNAGDPTVDPFHDLPPLVQVDGAGNVNIRVPRNRNAKGVEDDKGYVIYAPSGPQGSLQLSNVDHVIPGQTPTATTNGTARLASIPVITANSFNVELDTNQVNLLGNSQFRDHDADGDNALIKVDGGVDVTGGGFVDANPNDVAYGFEQFATVHSPGFFNANGAGQYVQTIDASKLSNGYHYVTVRAFRHRNGGEPPIFTDFRQVIYVDHSPTILALVSFNPIQAGVNENRELVVRSTDLRANNLHVFFDLPANLTNAQILSMVGSGSQANQIDRDLWTKDISSLTSGNHVATVVSFQIDGSANVQRFPGLFTSTIFGAGLGDVNFDGKFDAADVNLFDQVLVSKNDQFNPAADFNGDGLVNNNDLLLLYPKLQQVGADAATFAAYAQILGTPANGYTINEGGSLTLNVTQPAGTAPALTFGWDIDNHDANFGDASGAGATLTWAQLIADGVADEGAFPVSLRIRDGVNQIVLTTTLLVNEGDVLNGPATSIQATEGKSFNGALAVFTDSLTSNSASDFTATIDWGDGNTTSGMVNGGVGSLTVSGNHVYADEGAYSAKVTLSDAVPGTASATETVSVSVGEADGLSGTPTPFNPTQGTAFSGQVTTFTDSYTGNLAGDFTASINWGDGAVTSGTVSGGGGTFTVSGGHTYTQDRTFTVAVTLTDKDDDGSGAATAAASTTAVVTVADANNLSGTATPIQAAEGMLAAALANFTDTFTGSLAGDFTASIDWGDGATTSGTITGGAGTFTVSGGHSYADESVHTATITFTEIAGAKTSAQATATATVSEGDALSGTPTPIQATEGSAFSGQVATFTDSYTGNTAADFTASIDWGDGATTTGTVGGGAGIFTVNGNHSYGSEGSYTAVVTLTDDGGAATAQAVASVVATVGDADNLSGTASPIQTTEGTPFAGVVATFSDTFTGSLAGDFTATIDWGDGAVTSGTITGGAGGFTVSGGHTYADEGSHPLAVTLREKAPGAAQATALGMVVVADADDLSGTATPIQTNVGAPFSAVVATFTDGFPGASAADFAASIDWGDGVVTSGVIGQSGGVFTISGAHTYTATGSYTVAVAFQDDALGAASAVATTMATIRGDIAVRGTSGRDTLTLTRTPGGGIGWITYVLDGAAPVSLTGVTSFRFFGAGGGDSMTVSFANGGPLVSGPVFFDGGDGTGALVVDAPGKTVRTQPGAISVDDPQDVLYTNVSTVSINAGAVGVFGGSDGIDKAAFVGLTPAERFVQSVYQDELGRAGDKTELDGWAAALAAGSESQAQIAAAVSHSFEGRDHVVKGWYLAFLGRAAVNGEELGWVDLLRQQRIGQTDEAVLSQILSGAEFYAHAQTLVSTGTADERYVQALYRLLLNRSSAADETAGWVATLQQQGRQGAALGILHSTECRTDEVEACYDALLERPSDPPGLNTWVFSNLDMRSIRIAFESTSEFFVLG